MITELLFTRPPWEHQLRGVQQTIDALEAGAKSICLTAPTGSGKTAMQIALARWEAEERGGRVLCLTNRILLTEQTRRVFRKDEVSAGVISASMKWARDEDAQVQIATIQTILARRRKEDYWVNADLVLADEVHQVSTGESADLLNEYKERGARVVGITATPLGVSNVCDELIVAARTRELQDDGILCHASWFAPSELDTRRLVKGKIDLSLSENDARKTWGPLKGDNQIRTRIVGNILENYRKIYPAQMHTLAFAPGVKESLWAAQFCRSMGIRSLHVDGTDFWVDGEMCDRKQSDATFQRAMQEWRDGEIPILWNRFVLREGIDEPQIKCILLATPIGSYRSFLQMVGRGLRTHPSKEFCIVIDFGGCLDEKSEILTQRGWLGIDEITDDDVVGTMNLETSAFEWCRNQGTIRKQRGSDMISTRAPHLDFRVTDYHQMVMTPDNRQCKWRKQSASDLAARKSVCQIPVSLIEDVPPSVLTDSEITFIGWYFTDGCLHNDRVSIYQSEAAPREHHESIIQCLEGCGFRYTVRKRSRPPRFESNTVTHEVSYHVTSGKKCAGGYKHLTPWLDKSFPLDVFNMLDRRQFGVLLHAMNLGDGCKHKGYNQQTVTLAVARRDAANNIQSLAVRRGYRCNIAVQSQDGGEYRKPSEIYLLHIRDTRHAHIMPGVLVHERVHTDERVWCVQTENGTLICRRNGRVCVMGNSWWRHGSVNVNVDWESVFDCEDPDVISKNRIAEARETGEPLGRVCHNCGVVLNAKSRVLVCPHCGHKMHLGKPSRPILQADGTLTQVSGEPISQWKIKRTPEAEDIWRGLYWNARKKDPTITFNALYARFGYKTAVLAGSKTRPAFWHSYYPPRDLPFMPKNANDWHRGVGFVRSENLH